MSLYNRQKIVDSVPQKGFFGHPKGLFTLFFTEFWERFSYYGMRAILVFYMYYEVSKGGLGLDQTTALSIMSIYGSLVYMSGIIGGWLADRVLGTSRAIFYGGILIMFGHIVLAIPGSLSMFFVSMVLIVLGTGLLKPNVSSVVGEIYSENDNRRDAGFSIFYMGINLGGFLAPLIVGSQTVMDYSFHLGFAFAAIGMFFGLVLFLATKKTNLGLAGTIPTNPLSAEEKKKVFTQIGIGIVIIAVLAVIAVSMGALTIESFINLVGILGIVIPALYFIFMYRSPKTTSVERSRLIAYIPLFIAAVMFWAIQEQGSTILASYADKRTQLDFAGIHVSPAWFQSLNPLFIIILAPVFAWLWVKLGNRQPTIPQKFSLGLLFAGLSFLVILLPVYYGGASLVNPLWLVLSYFLVVLGELCLSPVGLSATTKLAPAAFSAQTMSLWFLANAAAQAINAQLVKFYTPENEMFYFGLIGGASLVLGVILLALAPKIQGFMKGIR
ncbi:peptide MFS transporter [Peribacillus cavernae]|uniref:Peptide MFS transporter n=1 Tax=Peribacillus cavernae TaxID=1674310 RepID=A0A3S0W5I2_9BACI|nr:peptide MFS transporter [Peribacillus cavernae]MDQ0217674.1 POT family proton-dependent oligopeptide transporter [Peribacillus cavernae]RUQ28147.1 peptide MFS transporter [Peribacillus cavernae]